MKSCPEDESGGPGGGGELAVGHKCSTAACLVLHEHADLGLQWLTDSRAGGDELQDRKLKASERAHPYKDGQFTSSFLLPGIEFIKWIEIYLQQA